MNYSKFYIPFVIIFLTVFVQSSAEELLCRGFLYQRLRRSYKHPAVAIVGNSALFADLVLILGCVLLFMWGRKKKSVEVENE